MQTELHRNLKETEVTCGCGNEFTVFSTEDQLKVEICSECHPFYTGQQKLVDTEGRVEKFQDKYGWSEERASEIAGTAPSSDEDQEEDSKESDEETDSEEVSEEESEEETAEETKGESQEEETEEN